MSGKREDQPQKSSGRDGHLQSEYQTLADTFCTIKRRAAQLRRDNEFLQDEIHKTRLESQEYTSYISKQTEKRRSAIETLNDETQKKLKELRRQREEALEQYQEQATEMKREILKKENELAVLNFQIAGLKKHETLRQQQLSQIADLEQEIAAMRHHHAESLSALKASFFKEKEHYEEKAKHTVQAFTQAANQEASHCLHSHIKKVSQENQHLRKELQQLISREKIQRLHRLHSFTT